MKLLLARLTAMVIFLDETYNDIANFVHHLYLGETQPTGVLILYHQDVQELSKVHKGGAVFRGFAVRSWLTFIDVCMLEKRLLTINPELRASPRDMGTSDYEMAAILRLFEHRRATTAYWVTFLMEGRETRIW